MVHTLLKFQTKPRLESFQKEGLLYLNTREYFRELEKGNESRKEIGIGDQYEQTYKIENIQPAIIEFEYEDGSIEVTKSKSLHIITYDLLTSGHVFCMTGLSDNKTIEMLDKKLFSFGEYCCIIENPVEFLKRVQKLMETNGIEFEASLVEYCLMSEGNRKMTAFIKPNYLSFQSEFRIFTKTKEKEPIILKIGDISDISYIVETKKLNCF